MRILAYLHVSHAGIFGFSDRVMVGESADLRLMNPIDAVEVANANRDVIVGIKVRVGLHASGTSGAVPLRIALEVAEAVGMPLMAHIDHPPPSYEEVIEMLRPGDILTHAFRPFPNSPATDQGTVKREVLEARKRGVKFDIGHGKGSFAFKTARAMLANGFLPDTISSDVHQLCINGPAFDQVTTMSKFLCIGMQLGDVIAASTVNAAMALKRPELGSLKPGSVGDATILSVKEGRFDYVDVVGEHLEGDRKIARRAWWWPGAGGIRSPAPRHVDQIERTRHPHSRRDGAAPAAAIPRVHRADGAADVDERDVDRHHAAGAARYRGDARGG